MKVAILITLYTTEDDAINQYVRDFSNAITEIQYEPCSLVVGKHRISKRPHTHIHFIANVLVKDGKPKTFKGLDSRLRRTQSMLPGKFVVKYNISINYDDGEKDKKGHMFDEESIYSYALKEYDTKKIMDNDIHNLFVDFVWNAFAKQDLFDKYRSIGNKIWVKSEKYKNNKYNNTQKEFKEGLYNYLDQVIITCSVNLTDISAMVRYVVKHILAHYKNNGKCFNPLQLKSQALNYLYFTDKIDEGQICDYMNI